MNVSRQPEQKLVWTSKSQVAATCDFFAKDESGFPMNNIRAARDFTVYSFVCFAIVWRDF